MSGISYNTLVTMIKDYTEVDSNVFTTAILESFILNAQQRIMMDLPMDSDRFVDQGTMATDVDNIRVPAGTLFVRGVEVFNATNTTEKGTWLERRDQTFLSEYVGRLTGPEGSTTSGADVTGKPKYYAMFGGATGLGATDSGSIYLAPTPDANYNFRIYYNKMPDTLESSNQTNYVSLYFPQGLLYACLVEAYGFLKGPTDMLTLYEQKYKTELQKFAAMQIGRRRRDDYTDGTIRIPIESPPQ
ncbi:MAG: hypothetical protein CBD88_08665 [Flavobacteriales bacterium TMED228]|nr:MAG: hypothetical protein CBD88_08665 [Flavobacteriales bacterium TMED228]